MYYSALESKGKIISDKEILTYYRFHNSASNYVGDSESKITHKSRLFRDYISQLEAMSKMFKNKTVNRIIFNYTISLRMEIDILHKLGYSNINEKMKIIYILKYLFIFYYLDSKKFYIFKYIKLLQLYIMPKKLCKIIEYKSLELN